MGRLISPAGIALTFLAIAHGVFAWNSRDIRPQLSIVTSPPSPATRDALAFGDHQLLYRFWALDLQNAGDTGGRATPMRDYNYDYVIGWLAALHDLDLQASHHVVLAAHYFAQTPNLSDVRRIVEFIVRDAEASPKEKWYWLTQAIALAETRLNDAPYALDIAERLARYDFPEMPHWIFMFPAVLLEKMGRTAEARAVIEDVQLKKRSVLTEDELLWIEFFTQKLGIPK